MAKQFFEQKKVTKICGTLDKDENGEYIVTVQDKDSVEEFVLTEILDGVLGTVISFQSEDAL